MEAITGFRVLIGKSGNSVACCDRERLLDYLRTCTIVAIYDNKRAARDGLILHYTVILNDRRKDGDRWVYTAICLSDGGMYEHAEVTRGRHCGSKIKFSDLPAEVRQTLSNIGYFI